MVLRGRFEDYLIFSGIASGKYILFILSFFYWVLGLSFGEMRESADFADGLRGEMEVNFYDVPQAHKFLEGNVASFW